jgi:multidrug resistance efflux pump
MIEARFDPVDWRAELERVYLDLAEIEKDMMQARNQGGGMSEDVEEFKRHMDLI